jgi:surfeit locus 1 family protein
VRRFPLGLTLASAIAFAILIGLGTWQLHRLAWKQALLARIAALQNVPARPIAPVLQEMARGQDVAYTRVSVSCAPSFGPEPIVFRYALHDGEVGWRAMSICRLAGGGPYDGILLDRGLATRLGGAMAPSALAFAPPQGVTGVLREVGAKPLVDSAAPDQEGSVTVVRLIDRDTVTAVAAKFGVKRPASLLLAVEREQPPIEGLAPAALPQDIPNNHFVYAATWFALAGILAWFYVALLWRRLRSR